MHIISIIAACFGMGFFFLLQITLARFFRPKSEDRFIFAVWLIAPFLLFLSLWMFNFFGVLDKSTAFAAYLLFFVMASSWVASYPAIYADCPTLIISYMAWKKKSGVLISDVEECLALKKNSTDRIDDAQNNFLIEVKGDHLQLTFFGKAVGRFFMMYRKMIGLRMNPL